MKIEDLKVIAEKATPGPWASVWLQTITLYAVPKGMKAGEIRREDERFVTAFNPALALKLLKVAEAADILCNGQPSYGHVYAAHEAQVERIKALGLALRELEAEHG